MLVLLQFIRILIKSVCISFDIFLLYCKTLLYHALFPPWGSWSSGSSYGTSGMPGLCCGCCHPHWTDWKMKIRTEIFTAKCCSLPYLANGKNLIFLWTLPVVDWCLSIPSCIICKVRYHVKYRVPHFHEYHGVKISRVDVAKVTDLEHYIIGILKWLVGDEIKYKVL